MKWIKGWIPSTIAILMVIGIAIPGAIRNYKKQKANDQARDNFAKTNSEIIRNNEIILMLNMIPLKLLKI